MSDRTYFILRNRVERRLEKPRTLIPHMGLFTAYTVIFGGMSMITRPQGNMDGIFYWTIFAWSVIVGMHTIYAYMRSGAWAATRERLIQEEILEFADEFALSEAEMIDLHERLSQDIRGRAKDFDKLAWIGGGFFILWPGSLILLFILQRLLVGSNPPEDNQLLAAVFQLWQPLSVLGTLVLSMMLVPWRQLLPQAKSRQDLREVYQGKGKRGAERLSTEVFDDEGEILPEYEEKYKQNSAKGI
jgi:hypothetical protein